MEISYKNDQIAKTKALNKLFFENNRVITSAYDCEKREKLNKIMLNNY